MSVFGSIVSAIFGSKHAAPATGAAATAFIVRDSSIAEACGRRRSAWCNRGNTDLESRRRSDSCQSRR